MSNLARKQDRLLIINEDYHYSFAELGSSQNVNAHQYICVYVDMYS